MLVSTHAQQYTGYSKVSYHIIQELVKHPWISVTHFGFQKHPQANVAYRPYPSGVDVIDAAYFLTAGDLTEVKILRGNDRFSITVKPVAHPSKADNGLRAEALTTPVRIGN